MRLQPRPAGSFFPLSPKSLRRNPSIAALFSLGWRARLSGLLTCLTLLVLAQASAQAQPATAAKKPGVKEPIKKIAEDVVKPATPKVIKQDPPAAKPPVQTWQVLGRGRTLEEAEKDALEKTRKLLEAFLLRQDPPFVWTTPKTELIKNMVVGTKRLEKEDVEISNQLEKVKMLCWEWTVQISPSQLQEMRREDARYRVELARQQRQERAEERMIVLGKFTGWTVLALAGVFLYLRLDQWTQGTLRGWLRVALVGLLGSSGIGWWLLS
jgi:hypothetical protein